MPEQYVGAVAGDMQPAGEAAQWEAIAAKIVTLIDYGPIRVTTRVPDIPGAEYLPATPDDVDQRPIAHINYKAFSVGTSASLAWAVWTGGQQTPVTLRPTDIEDVGIDHPYGKDMPLHGKILPAVGLAIRDGVPVLQRPDYVREYGWHDRFEAETHPEYPGISIVRAYNTQQQDDVPKTFLISRTGDRSFVVTSRIGYKTTTPAIVVRPPRDSGAEPPLHIEMLDMRATIDNEELLARHVRRYREASGDSSGYPSDEMTPFEADSIFLYMVND